MLDADVVLTYLNDHVHTDSRVISLQTLQNNWDEIRHVLENGCVVAVEKTDESVSTLWHVIKTQQHAAWIDSGRLRFITSGDSDPGVTNLNAEHFLAATIGSQEITTPVQYSEQSRPYTFLFLNRKIRPHRRYLIQELQRRGLLDQALWSCLETHNTQSHPEHTRVYAAGLSLQKKQLDHGYDPDVSPDWIDGILYARHYQDTWFSLVSETGFEYPHSFRTEKIWKPILAAHPFMVCANTGFYRDLKNLGFRTFDHWIDESFDSVADGQQRLDRLGHAVQWLCQQDLAKFWQETRDICLYNHQQALELHSSLKMDFSRRFLEFMHA